MSFIHHLQRCVVVVLVALMHLSMAVAKEGPPYQPNPVFFARPKGDHGPAIAYDVLTGQERWSWPAGVLSADGSTFVTADFDTGEQTALRTYSARVDDELFGEETLLMPLRGNWWLNAVSSDGQFVALVRAPSEKEQQAWAKNGKWQTEFQIIDTRARGTKHTLKLDGNFEAEALSKDGTSLFLVEHLPAGKPDHYAIRWYDLSREQLIADPLRSKTTDEIMTGYAWGGAATADGEWLFTLYISTNRKVAFVHMLNTREKYTVCVDLPSGDGDFEALQGYTLAYAPEKQTLYAANARLGAVAEINLGNYAFNGTGNKFVPNKVTVFKPVKSDPFFSPSMPVAKAVLAQDEGRLFFADGSAAYGYDIAHGKVDKTFRADNAITGLGLNPQDHLLAAQWNLDAVKTFDVASGRAILPAQAKANCPISKPTGFVPPNGLPKWRVEDFPYGTDKLWTAIYNKGMWGPVGVSGDYGEKVFWWSKDYDLQNELQPNLLVTAQRLDVPGQIGGISPPTNAFAGDIGEAMLVGVDFPTAGCWQITGSYRGDTLRFVVWVQP